MPSAAPGLTAGIMTEQQKNSTGALYLNLGTSEAKALKKFKLGKISKLEKALLENFTKNARQIIEIMVGKLLKKLNTRLAE